MKMLRNIFLKNRGPLFLDVFFLQNVGGGGEREGGNRRSLNDKSDKANCSLTNA